MYFLFSTLYVFKELWLAIWHIIYEEVTQKHYENWRSSEDERWNWEHSRRGVEGKHWCNHIRSIPDVALPFFHFLSSFMFHFLVPFIFNFLLFIFFSFCFSFHFCVLFLIFSSSFLLCIICLYPFCPCLGYVHEFF